MSLLRLACAVVVLAAGLGAETPAPDQESPLEKLARESLPLRTALHKDPTLGTPLDRLLSLYREPGQVEALLATYQRHLDRFASDRNARIVLVRLLHATNDERARAEAARAVARHPDDPMLLYLQARAMRAEDESLALQLLTAAIAHETYAPRIESWVDELLPMALAADRRDLVASHLGRLAELAGDLPAARAAVARRMLEHGLAEQCLAELERASAMDPDPEVQVELDLATAGAMVSLGRREEAAERLDALLAKVTGDYWRRGEILTRRALLATSSREEEVLLADLRAANDGTNVGAALDLAAVLVRLGRHRDALTEIRVACAALPRSRLLEEEAIRLFESLRDQEGLVEFLATRLAAAPEREDLALVQLELLLATGREDEASAALQRLEATLPRPVFVRALAEVAEFLAGRTLAEDAARLYERILDLDPANITARTALARTLVSLRRPRGVRAALTAHLPDDLTAADIAAIVAGLMEHGHLRAARDLLESRIDDESLELVLLRARVSSRLGADTTAILEQARGLADSSARYRQWLSVAVPTWGDGEEQAAALGEEGQRLLNEAMGAAPLAAAPGAEPSRDTVERIEAIADECRRTNSREVAVELLETAVANAGNTPPLPLLRRLAALRETAPDGGVTAERELGRLEALDPGHRAEYRARRALLLDRRGREDLARELLVGLNPTEIGDPGLLDDLSVTYQRWQETQKHLAILERALVVSPDEKRLWSTWLEALGALDDEPRLRGALRRVLGQRERLALAGLVVQELRAHLADSYWRSIHALLRRGDDGALHEASQLLDSVERISARSAETAPEAWLWVLWTRTEIDRQLGRQAVVERRREALRDAWDRAWKLRQAEQAAWLEEVAAAASGSGQPSIPGPAPATRPSGTLVGGPGGSPSSDSSMEEMWFGMRLPDGLIIGRDAIAPSPSAISPDEEPVGNPLPPHDLRWASVATAPVAAIHALGADRILVVQRGGGCHCLDRHTGKLLWERIEVPPPLPSQVVYASIGGVAILPPHLGLLVVGDRFFACGSDAIECFDANGELVWRSEAPGLVPDSVALAAGGDRLFAFGARAGWIAAFDAAGGRLLWERSYPGMSSPGQTSPGCGAVVSTAGLLVWGEGVTLLDAGTGVPRWRTDPAAVRPREIMLEAPPAGGPGFFAGSGSPTAASEARRLGDVAAWGSRPRGGPRAAWATGDHLALWRDGLDGAGHVLVTHTTLPILGEEMQVEGTIIGSSGTLAVLLTPGAIEILDLSTRERRRVPLERVQLDLAAEGSRTSARWQATVRGDLAHVAMPAGVVVVNIRSAEVIAATPWPAELTELATEAELQSTTTMPRFLLVGIADRDGSPQPRRRDPGCIASARHLYVVAGESTILCLGEDTSPAVDDSRDGER